MMVAIHGHPKGGQDLPALVQIHGGGGSGNEYYVLANAKEGSVLWLALRVA